VTGRQSEARPGPWDAWPVSISVPVAWGEMDAFGHVNNVTYFRYFESARIEYFGVIGFLGGGAKPAGIGPILAHTECRFRIPLEWPAMLRVTARVGELRADGFIMRYAVFEESSGNLAAEGTGRIVAFDYARGAKVPVPEGVAARIRDLEGDAPP
jgi:acyl-CoA thioester hydrolase